MLVSPIFLAAQDRERRFYSKHIIALNVSADVPTEPSWRIYLQHSAYVPYEGMKR